MFSYIDMLQQLYITITVHIIFKESKCIVHLLITTSRSRFPVTYILLDVLVYNIAVYFYEFCSILTSPQGESKYKERVKIYSDIVHQNTPHKLFIIQLL